MEPESGGGARMKLVDQLAAHRFPKSFDDRGLVEAGDRGDQSGIDVFVDDGGGGESTPGGVRQRGEAVGHDGCERGWHESGNFLGGLPAVTLPPQELGIDE